MAKVLTKKQAQKEIAKLGYSTLRMEFAHRTFWGGNANHVIVLLNSEGRVLSLDGNRPYCPEGREHGFLYILQNGGFINESWLTIPKNA